MHTSLAKNTQICGTLLVDLHPKSPASAQAALNIVRCSLSAGGLAMLQIIIDSVGVGWCFTILACLCFGMLLPVWVVHKYGAAWRKATIPARKLPDIQSQSPMGVIQR